MRVLVGFLEKTTTIASMANHTGYSKEGFSVVGSAWRLNELGHGFQETLRDAANSRFRLKAFLSSATEL